MSAHLSSNYRDSSLPIIVQGSGGWGGMIAPPPRIWPQPPPAHNGTTATRYGYSSLAQILPSPQDKGTTATRYGYSSLAQILPSPQDKGTTATRYGYSSLAQILPSPQDKGDEPSHHQHQGTTLYSEEPVKLRKESKHSTTTDWRRPKDRCRVKLEPGLTPCQVQEVTTSSKHEQHSGGIPVGIAVARQRVQQQSTPPPLTVLTCEERSTNQVTGWTGPAPHWHYPGVEQNLPLQVPPLQLGRDPVSGQILILPSGSLGDSMQRTVLWPSGNTSNSSMPPPLVMPGSQPVLLDRFVTLATPPSSASSGHHHQEKRRSHDHSSTTLHGTNSGGVTVGLFPPPPPPHAPFLMMPFSHQNNSLLLSTQLTEHNLNTMVVTNHQLSESAVLNPMEVISSPVDGFGGSSMIQQLPPSVVISHTETNSFVRSDINAVYPAQAHVQPQPHHIPTPQPDQVVIKEEVELAEESPEPEEPDEEEKKAEVVDASNQTESPRESEESEEESPPEEVYIKVEHKECSTEDIPPPEPDMSGLALLVDSIAQFERRSVEQPVLPAQEEYQPPVKMHDESVKDWKENSNNISSGLGLLCTVVERCLEEEVVDEAPNGDARQESEESEENSPSNESQDEDFSEVGISEESQQSIIRRMNEGSESKKDWYAVKEKDCMKEDLPVKVKKRPGRPKKKLKKSDSPNRNDPPVLRPWMASPDGDKSPLGSPPTLTPHKRKLSQDRNQESDEGSTTSSTGHPPPLSPISPTVNIKKRKVGRPKKKDDKSPENTERLIPKSLPSSNKSMSDLFMSNKPQDIQQSSGSHKIKPKLKAEAKVKDWCDDEELDLTPVKGRSIDDRLLSPPVWASTPKPKATSLSPPPRKSKLKVIDDVKKEIDECRTAKSPLRTLIKSEEHHTSKSPVRTAIKSEEHFASKSSVRVVNKPEEHSALKSSHTTAFKSEEKFGSESPLRRVIKSEEHCSLKSPLQSLIKSDDHFDSKAPLQAVNKSEENHKSKSPLHTVIKSEGNLRSKSPLSTVIKSEENTKSKSPLHTIIKSEGNRKSKSSLGAVIKSEENIKSKSPVRNAIKSEGNLKSQSPLSTVIKSEENHKSKSPLCTGIKSEEHHALKSPVRTTIKSPKPLQPILKQSQSSSRAVSPHRSPSPKTVPSTSKPESLQTTKLPNCKLTDQQLKSLPCRILSITDGQFYPGEVTKIIAPDIYEVQIFKERCRKPQIFCRDEILSSSVAEVHCPEDMFIPSGTRVCAYWSQQYSCFYPGRVVSDSRSGQRLPIDFDDGDNGTIERTSVRFLPQDYPIVDDSVKTAQRLSLEQPPNPIMGKRKRYNSSTSSDSHKNNDTTESESCNVSSEVEEKHPKKCMKKEDKLADKKPSQIQEKVEAIPVKISVAKKKSLRPEDKHGDKSLKVEEPKKKLLKAEEPKKKLVKVEEPKKKLVKVEEKQDKKLTPVLTKSEDNQLSLKTKKISTDKSEIKDSTASPGPVKKQTHNEKLEETDDDYDDDDNDDDDIEEDPRDAINSVVKGFFESEELEKEKLKNEEKIHKHHHHRHRDGTKPHKCKHKHHRSHKHRHDESRRHGKDSSDRSSKGINGDPLRKGNGLVPLGGAPKSKVSAILPERLEPWTWVGEGVKRGRALGPRGKGLKMFYQAIRRGHEVIRIRDCAVFVSTGRPDRPFIGQIEAFWQCHMKKNMLVKVSWFYHPEETIGCPDNLPFPGGLFKSPHVDNNDVQTISHKCEVLSLPAFKARAEKTPGFLKTVYENNMTYYLAGHYQPAGTTLTLEPGVAPPEEENCKNQTGESCL